MIFNVGGAAFKPPVLNPSYPTDVQIVESSSASATFQVVISEAGEPAEYAYQWYVNNSPVSGATSASYTKSNLSSVGTYIIYCTVTHPAGVVTSRSATLTVLSSQPTYTYSGSHELIKEGTYNWKIKLKTTGTLRFSHLGNFTGTIDVFLVGGGAGGSKRHDSRIGGGGGGGGRTTTFNTTVKTGTDYVITIGGGGSANGGGGATTAFSRTANGGSAPSSESYLGGSGGSGGGTSNTDLKTPGAGGSDGSDGGKGYSDTAGGTGQHTTTREFGESTGTLYAGGGGAGGGKNASGANPAGGAGGAGGGGRGGGNAGNPQSGSVNTGGGGGGGQPVNGGSPSGASGGSGIVVIRNKR